MKNKIPDISFPKGTKKAALWSLLRYGHDVSVDRLATSVNCESKLFADQQPYLSAHFSHMNEQLAEHGLRIKPGKRRRSYRVVEL